MEINYFPVLLSFRAFLTKLPKCNKRKGPFTQAIYVAAALCNFLNFTIAPVNKA